MDKNWPHLQPRSFNISGVGGAGMKAMQRLEARREYESRLFDRNGYARRAIAAKVDAEKVKRIFALSDTAYQQLVYQVQAGVTA